MESAPPWAAERLLAAVRLSQKFSPSIRLDTLIVFLSVCTHEGLGIKDLVYVCRLSESMVSRAVDSLCHPDNGALLCIHRHATDGRRRMVYLTAEGRDLLSLLQETLDRPFAEVSENASSRDAVL